MSRVRLLLLLLGVLAGSFATRVDVVLADGYAYDAPQLARVEVDVVQIDDIPLPQLSAGSVGRVGARSSLALGTSTAPFTLGYATNNGRTPTPAEAEAMVRGANPVGSGLNPDAQHAASSFGIDRIASQGSVFRIVGGDGVTRTLIQVPEVAGRYEWMVDDCGNLTHARHIPGGSINGIPNQE